MPDSFRPFSLLLVCTGNVARSPTGERLIARVIGSGVVPRSAGTYAVVGEPIAAPLAGLLRAVGASADDFAACQLTEQLIMDANLVLAMTREHRAAVVELWPAAVRRTFTLLEFARLVQLINPDQLPTGDAATRLSAAIPLAAAQRRQVSGGPGAYDIPDPYGKSEECYAAAFEHIHTSVRAIGSAIGLANDQSRSGSGTLEGHTV